MEQEPSVTLPTQGVSLLGKVATALAASAALAGLLTLYFDAASVSAMIYWAAAVVLCQAAAVAVGLAFTSPNGPLVPRRDIGWLIAIPLLTVITLSLSVVLTVVIGPLAHFIALAAVIFFGLLTTALSSSITRLTILAFLCGAYFCSRSLDPLAFVWMICLLLAIPLLIHYSGHEKNVATRALLSKGTWAIIMGGSLLSWLILALFWAGDAFTQRQQLASAALHKAIGEGNVPAVEQHITRGTPIGLAELRVAVTSGRADISRQLKKNAGPLAANDEVGLVVLAIQQGHSEIACDLIGDSEALTAQGAGVDLLRTATELGDAEVFSCLIEQGWDFQSRPELLFTAIRKQHVGVIEAWLAHGGGIQFTDHRAFTPLKLAAMLGHVEVVKTLLPHCDDVDEKWAESGRDTALATAIGARQTAVVEVLLAAGASQQILLSSDQTPLQTAARGDPERLAVLLTYTDDPDETWRGADVGLPLLMAVEALNTECVELLLDAGADINRINVRLRTSRGTPLDFAKQREIRNRRGNEECTKLLIERGAKTVLELSREGN